MTYINSFLGSKTKQAVSQNFEVLNGRFEWTEREKVSGQWSWGSSLWSKEESVERMPGGEGLWSVSTRQGGKWEN